MLKIISYIISFNNYDKNYFFIIIIKKCGYSHIYYEVNGWD